MSGKGQSGTGVSGNINTSSNNNNNSHNTSTTFNNSRRRSINMETSKSIHPTPNQPLPLQDRRNGHTAAHTHESRTIQPNNIYTHHNANQSNHPQNYQARIRPRPRGDDVEGASSLLPIWALRMTINALDHSTTATGNSTTPSSTSAQHHGPTWGRSRNNSIDSLSSNGGGSTFRQNSSNHNSEFPSQTRDATGVVRSRGIGTAGSGGPSSISSLPLASARNKRDPASVPTGSLKYAINSGSPSQSSQGFLQRSLFPSSPQGSEINGSYRLTTRGLGSGFHLSNGSDFGSDTGGSSSGRNNNFSVSMSSAPKVDKQALSKFLNYVSADDDEGEHATTSNERIKSIAATGLYKSNHSNKTTTISPRRAPVYQNRQQSSPKGTKMSNNIRLRPSNKPGTRNSGSSNNRKHSNDPTGVSSFTTAAALKGAQSPIAFNLNAYQNNYASASSVISSNFSASSYSGLYNRARMAKTADGFHYMPSLHLSRNNSTTSSKVGGGTASEVGTAYNYHAKGDSSMTSISNRGRLQNSNLLKNIAQSTLNQDIDRHIAKKDDPRQDQQQHPSPATKSFFLNSREIQEAAKQDERIKEWRDQQYLQSLSLKVAKNRISQVHETSLSTIEPKSSSQIQNGDIGNDINMEVQYQKQKNQRQDQNITDPSSPGVEGRDIGKPPLRRDISASSNLATVDGEDSRTDMPNEDADALKVPSLGMGGKRRRRKNTMSPHREGSDNAINDATRFFPVTSPRRIGMGTPNNTSRSENKSGSSSPPAFKEPTSSQSTSNTKPLVSPPRAKRIVDNTALQEPRSNKFQTIDSESTDSFVISSPPRPNRKSDPAHLISNSDSLTNDLTIESLCTPTRENLKSTCLSVIPKITTAMSVDSLSSQQSSPIITIKGPASFLPKAVLNWAPYRSPSSDSSLGGDRDSSNCSLNPHDDHIDSHTMHEQSEFSSTPLSVWENCLYVKAEGARAGKICVTATHLIFVYEDEVSDNILFENGLTREDVSEYFDGTSDIPSRGATPVNIPPDESGDGGGFELIGGCSDNHSGRITVSDMFECGFKGVIPDDISHQISSLETSKSKSNDIGSLRQNIDAMVTNLEDLDDPALVAPTSTSSASASSSSSFDADQQNPQSRRRNKHTSPETISIHSSSFEESYEEMMNKCIIRAIEEEARRRLQELDYDEEASAKMSTVASCSTWDKEHLSTIEQRAGGFMTTVEENLVDDVSSFLDNDGSVCGAHTHISSFSELEMDIDPDEERSMYIASDDDSIRQNFIGIKWPLDNFSEIYPRRYMMRDVAFEIFGSPSTASSETTSTEKTLSPLTLKGKEQFSDDIENGFKSMSPSSVFLVIPDCEVTNDDDDGALGRFGRRKKIISRRDSFIDVLKKSTIQLNFVFWDSMHLLQSNILLGNAVHDLDGGKRRAWTPTSLFRRRIDRVDPLQFLTRLWRKGFISNFDYLLRLNSIAGRSFHDPGNYPIMPWVLSNYVSTSSPDLSDKSNFRDLSKPMGALNPERLNKFKEKYTELCGADTAIPPFMYGSHYSNIGGVVLHYLVRNKPFAGLHRQLQGGQFDVPDRLFRSVAQTWDICSRISATEVKELTPEWYSDPSFLKNANDFNLGTSVDGSMVNDVELPPWADNDPNKFIEVMRNALESDTCSAMLPAWIDLIFGFKQRGPEAEKACNVFYHLTYYEPEDLANIEDETLRTGTELHISDFGHCPAQLFFKPHPQKKCTN